MSAVDPAAVMQTSSFWAHKNSKKSREDFIEFFGPIKLLGTRDGVFAFLCLGDLNRASFSGGYFLKEAN